jgi:hypothetical protein
MFADEYNECDFSGCENFINQRIYDPTKTIYTTGLIIIGLGKVHQLGMGVSFSQFGFSHSWSTQGQRSEQFYHVWNYTGIKVRHRMNFLQSSIIKLGFANSFDFNFRHNQNWFYGLKNRGISHIAECIIGLSASKLFELNLNFLYRTALTKYGEQVYKKHFHRFGTGLMLGISYRL